MSQTMDTEPAEVAMTLTALKEGGRHAEEASAQSTRTDAFPIPAAAPSMTAISSGGQAPAAPTPTGTAVRTVSRPSVKQENGRGRRSGGGSKTRLFLPSLYEMCNNDDDEHRQCICWSDDGTTFWVSNTEKFSRLILPMYFRHNNYASFVRQLNMYGFQRSTESKGKVKPGVPMVEHFTHQFFLRGREDLIGNIHRKTSSVAKASAPLSAPTSAGAVPEKKVESLELDLRAAEAAKEQMRRDLDELKEKVATMEQRMAQLERDRALEPAQPSKRRRCDDAGEKSSGMEGVKDIVGQLRSELESLAHVKDSVDKLHTLFATVPSGALDNVRGDVAQVLQGMTGSSEPRTAVPSSGMSF